MVRYLLLACLSALAGMGAARYFQAPPRVEIPEPIVKVITKTITKTEKGIEKPSITTEVITVEQPAPPKIEPIPQYRLRIGSSLDEKREVEIGAGRRLVGDLWLEGEINKSGQIKIGIGYEF